MALSTFTFRIGLWLEMFSSGYACQSPRGKAYASVLFLAGLRLMDVSERYGFTDASREGVRGGFVGWGEPSTLHVRLVAVDEAVGKRLGEWVYLWSAVDVYASKGRPILNALVLLRMHVRA